MHGAVIADFGILFDDVKSKGTLVYIAALHTLIQVDGVLIVRIDLDAPPKTVRIFPQFQRPGFVTPQHKPGFVVNQRSDIAAEGVRKRTRRNAFRRSWPKFVGGIKNGEVALDKKALLRFPRFKF